MSVLAPPVVSSQSVNAMFGRFVLDARSGSAHALNRAAFSLGGVVASGLLCVDRVRESLVRAAVAGGMTLAAARKVVLRGLEDGAAQPFVPTVRSEDNNLAAFAGVSEFSHELWAGRSGPTRHRVYLALLREAQPYGVYDEAENAFVFTSSLRYLAVEANVALLTVRSAVEYLEGRGLLSRVTVGTSITRWVLRVPVGAEDTAEAELVVNERLGRTPLLRNAGKGSTGRTGVRGEEIIHILAASQATPLTVSELSERTGLRAATVRANLNRLHEFFPQFVERVKRSEWRIREITFEDGSSAGFLTGNQVILGIASLDGSAIAQRKQYLRFEEQREWFEASRERFLERMVDEKRAKAAAAGLPLPPAYESKRIPRADRRAYHDRQHGLIT